MVNALENIFNGLNAHVDAYTSIIAEPSYSAAQKAKAKYFKGKLGDETFKSAALFILDICRAVSLFSKVSQCINNLSKKLVGCIVYQQNVYLQLILRQVLVYQQLYPKNCLVISNYLFGPLRIRNSGTIATVLKEKQ